MRPRMTVKRTQARDEHSALRTMYTRLFSTLTDRLASSQTSVIINVRKYKLIKHTFSLLNCGLSFPPSL